MKYPKTRISKFINFPELGEYENKQINLHIGKKWNYWFIQPAENPIRLSKGLIPEILQGKDLGELREKIGIFSIFKDYDFSDNPKEETVVDLWMSTAGFFNSATQGVLQLGFGTSINKYILYVIAPKLGNLRRKLFTIIRTDSQSTFPVNIICNIDGQEICNVSKQEFLSTIQKIIEENPVKHSIENLFTQSITLKNQN